LFEDTFCNKMKLNDLFYAQPLFIHILRLFHIVICVVVGWSIVIYHDYNLKTIIFEIIVILE